MPYEIITVPFNPVTHLFSAENLNRFCLNKMVRSSRAEFFNDGENSYWTVFLEYQSAIEPASKESAALTDAGKLCFEKLREWRRVTANPAVLRMSRRVSCPGRCRAKRCAGVSVVA